MTEPRKNKPRWEQDVDFSNMKVPLKNVLQGLKLIKKEYENKQKELIRLKGK